MKEFPLVKGGCGRSEYSVEFSAGVFGCCAIAAAILLIMALF